MAWKALFKLRWPDLVDSIQPVDWQQMYWQTHLQKYVNLINCMQPYIHCLYLIFIIYYLFYYIYIFVFLF